MVAEISVFLLTAKHLLLRCRPAIDLEVVHYELADSHDEFRTIDDTHCNWNRAIVKQKLNGTCNRKWRLSHVSIED